MRNTKKFYYLVKIHSFLNAEFHYERESSNELPHDAIEITEREFFNCNITSQSISERYIK